VRTQRCQLLNAAVQRELRLVDVRLLQPLCHTIPNLRRRACVVRGL
jgi:hypothetical protein